MGRDDELFILGEDVGSFGGAFKVTEGLFAKYGPNRVIDTPIAESAIIGACRRCGVDGPATSCRTAQYADFITPGVPDQWFILRPPSICGRRVDRFPWWCGDQAGPGCGRVPPPSARKACCRITPASRWWYEHADSSQGLADRRRSVTPTRSCSPSTRSSTERQGSRSRWRLRGFPSVRFNFWCAGDDVTIVTWGAMVLTSMEAAERLAVDGISVEGILDLQTIVPLDWEAVVHLSPQNIPPSSSSRRTFHAASVASRSPPGSPPKLLGPGRSDPAVTPPHT